MAARDEVGKAAEAVSGSRVPEEPTRPVLQNMEFPIDTELSELLEDADDNYHKGLEDLRKDVEVWH